MSHNLENISRYKLESEGFQFDFGVAKQVGMNSWAAKQGGLSRDVTRANGVMASKFNA